MVFKFLAVSPPLCIMLTDRVCKRGAQSARQSTFVPHGRLDLDHFHLISKSQSISLFQKIGTFPV